MQLNALFGRGILNRQLVNEHNGICLYAIGFNIVVIFNMTAQHNNLAVFYVVNKLLAVLRRFKDFNGVGIGFVGYIEVNYLSLSVSCIADIKGEYSSPNGYIAVLY